MMPATSMQTARFTSRQTCCRVAFLFFLVVEAALSNASISAAERASSSTNGCEALEGAIIRGPKIERKIAFAFTGHSFAEGADTILNELTRHKGKGSFFLTGAFLANTNFSTTIHRIVDGGHYVGPHSDKHLLYCPWDGPKWTLVTHEEFAKDLRSNLEKITRFGVKAEQIRYFLPPYEYYNQEIADWSREMGLTLVNYTPGTRSNADYTGEADTNFVSSKSIFDSIVRKEQKGPAGLNGFILLLHIGSGPGRADKFTARFGELLDYLAGKGYQFVRVDELLDVQ
jgi:peptidoglycan/xylan/chitin deacetylase (PgdA/CDA1 family)